jgi:glucose-1-phosphate adenylyltransferase
VLLDKNCKIEPGTVIGQDADADRARFPFVSESGIVLLPKGTVVPRQGPILLAADVDELIKNDSEMEPLMRDGSHEVASHDRHSFLSAGPRYLKYGPTALGDEEIAGRDLDE